SPVMAIPSAPRKPRRPRRGSLARPVNGSLYRVSFGIVALALLAPLFSLVTPTSLAKPPLPGSFDTVSALALARDLSSDYPNRAPGSAGALGAESWFENQLPMSTYGLRLSTTTWDQRVPGLGRVPL